MHLKHGIIAIAVIGAGALAGCSDDPEDVIDTRVSTTADFTQFKTFAFTRQSDMNPDLVQSIPAEVAVNLTSVNDSMREELTNIGLVEVDPSAGPDLRAFSLASTQDQESVYWECSNSYWYGYWYWTWAPCSWMVPVYTEYTEGSIVLGLVDPDTNDVVFGALIQGVADDPDDFDDRIDDDVEDAFEDYPRD